MSNIKRRQFLQTTAVTAAGFTILPSSLVGFGYKKPSDKLNIAFIGVGGRGENHIETLTHENIVAFCDVDKKRAAGIFKAYPDVPVFSDYRVMLDKMGKDIDAVVVSTPDHTHVDPALAAMELGKHVYVEKPLTHNIGEARQLLEASERYPVVTQMGNQGTSMECHARLAEIIQGGVVGDVSVVHVWTNRPVWPQGRPTPKGQKAPKHLDWNLWLGPAPIREYNPAYLPFKWRGWWDFGTGALGDMGCHLIDPAYRALKLTSPLTAEASCTTVWVGDFVEANYADSCPPSSIVKLTFGAREDMVPCELIWYDGGIRPMRPEGLDPNEAFGSWDGGILFEGTKGKLLTGIFGDKPKLILENGIAPIPDIPVTKTRYKGEHQSIWAEACKGNGSSPSPFSYAVPLTETLLMGNLAVRCFDYKVLKPGASPTGWAPFEYPGRVKLNWDAKQMKVTNLDEANRFVSRQRRAY